MAPIIIMTIEASQLLLLLNWMSPAFPTGAFAYSHGLEWAIEDGAVSGADDLKQWIEDLITCGSGWNDAVIFGRCWEDEAEELNELALALCTSKERHLETTQLGRAFVIAASIFFPSHPRMWGRGRGEGVADPGEIADVSLADGPPHPALSPANARERGTIAYPVAAGSACAAMGVEKSHALLAFLHGFCNALVSVAVRLVPLGQTAGLEVIRDLMPVIAATVERAAVATLDDLASITIGADIAAMKHETQHSRIFRT